MNSLLFGLITFVPLAAQVPYGWNQQSALGSDRPGAEPWYGGGLWAGDHHGPAPTLSDSLGLGNALSGTGFHLEGGFRSGNWDFAAEVLGNHDPSGGDYLTLYRSHIWHHSDRGWQSGFEQEPLAWGYGLNGGYVLGEAARPFPRLRVESPMADLHIFRVPLGTWGWQAFMGRLENHPVLSSSLQNPSQAEHTIATVGVPEAPFLMGYRVQAQFGPLMEFYLDSMNLWGGTRNGQAMSNGYSLENYVTAMLGIKDGLTEANVDYGNPGSVPTGPNAPQNVPQAVASATEIDVGFRLQDPPLARFLNADSSYLYISRGSKSAFWPVGVFLQRPIYYAGKDVSRDVTDLLLKPTWGTWWNTYSRYTAPSLNQPNDTVGVLVSWPRVRAGLEYFACVDAASLGFRPFTHGTYATGFYYYGDPLGNAMGGEAITTTAKVETDFTSRLSGTTRITRGFRPFRDDPTYWQLDHPGQTPGKDRFTGLQQTLVWKQGANTTVELGGAWQREGAVENVTGVSGNGFSWFVDVIYRWPGKFQRNQ
jgi:hypothetical protein